MQHRHPSSHHTPPTPNRAPNHAPIAQLRLTRLPALASALIAAILALALPGVATAQTPSPQPTPQSSTPTPTQPPGPSQTTTINEVELTATLAGVGGAPRRGDWFGARLTLASTTSDPARAIAVRLHIPDVDGDTALYERTTTLTLNRPRDLWLYAPVPANAVEGDPLLVTMHEVNEDTGAVGRLIASGRLDLRNIQPPDRVLIGTVGRSALALDQYELPHPRLQNARIVSSHLDFTVARGIDTDDLPDRWTGLAPFSTIAWAGEDPANLSPAQAAALAEWVERGGHLAVVLPQVATTWTSPNANPLAALLPDADIERLENTDLQPYQNLLWRPGKPPQTSDVPAPPALPPAATLHTVTPRDDARPGEAACIIEGPDGCVVAQRLVGAGAVTVIGLPIDDPRLANTGVLRADAFWHRILGYRFDIPGLEQIRDDRYVTNIASNTRTGDPAWTGDFITRSIARSGAAAEGVLLALIVFIAYWLLAGPLGFGILKKKKLERHAWLAFVAATTVFAAIAWLGAQAISPATSSVSHFTVIDHVYDQPQHRSKSWATILMPTYGERPVGVFDDPALNQPNNDAMFTFADPAGEAGLNFPDARDYIVPAESPDEFAVPARGTVKQFRADHLGPQRLQGTPTPVAGAEPRLVPGERTLAGAITHDLPAPLTDVLVYIVRPQLSELALLNTLRGQPDNENLSPLRADVHFFALSGDWQPNTAIDLAALEPTDRTRISTSAGATGSSDITPAHRLSFPGVIPQPDYYSRSIAATLPLYRSRVAPNLDLSRWTTRPAVIITGFINNADLPDRDRQSLFITPTQNGEQSPIPVSDGRILFRWIYPLNDQPPIFTGRD